MGLKAIYDSKDEIPAEYADLYTERSGKYELTGIEGVRTAADVERVHASLIAERAAHKTTKEKLQSWGDLKPEDVRAQLDRIPELEAGQGKVDEAKLQELVEAKINSRMAPKLRELKDAVESRTALEQQVTRYIQREMERAVDDSAMPVFLESKPHETSFPLLRMLARQHLVATPVEGKDGEYEVLTREGIEGVTPGIAPKDWLPEIQRRYPPLWPGSIGSGAQNLNGLGGAGGQNPWTHDHWNVTEQGKIEANNPRLAKQLKTAANFQGRRPAPPKSAA